MIYKQRHQRFKGGIENTIRGQEEVDDLYTPKHGDALDTSDPSVHRFRAGKALGHSASQNSRGSQLKTILLK